jgi:hypothetical protein
MIKALSRGKRKSDGTAVNTVFLGLSDENLRRLREDMPIYVDGRDVKVPDVDVVIFHGRTEESMVAMLERQGFDVKHVEGP